MIVKIKDIYEKNEILIQVLILILGILFSFIKNENLWFLFFTLVLVIQVGSQLYSLYKLHHKVICFPFVFFTLSYLFHYGHFPLVALHIPFGLNVLYARWYVNFEVYQLAAIFTLAVHTFLFNSFIYAYGYFNTVQTNYEIKKLKECNHLKYLRVIGYLSFIIGIIPSLIINGLKLSYFIKGGYANIFRLHIPDFVNIFSLFVNLAFFALIIGYSKNKKKSTMIFLLAIIYEVLITFTGGRGEAMTLLISLFIVWVYYVHQFKFKHYIYLFLSGYGALTLMNLIASYRRISQFNIFKIGKLIKQAFSHGQIISTLSEFGSTFSTIVFTIRSSPFPSFGSNYIFPIILTFPNVGGFNQKIVNSMIFTKHIYAYGQPIGGSYVAEMFYSFHWLGILMAGIFGILLAYLYYFIEKSYQQKLHFQFLIGMYFAPLLFFWIRGYFGAIYRQYIWHIGFAFIIVFALKYIRKKVKP